MALNINGTTGISGVDGSASAPAVTGTDSNTGINFGSDTVNINTGGTTRATVDSSGALDVPTTFPIKVNGSEKLKIESSGNLNLGSNLSSNLFSYLRFGASQYGAADVRPTDEGSHKVGLSFYTDGTADTTINPTERMRVDSSGRVLIGTTSQLNAGFLNILFNGSAVNAIVTKTTRTVHDSVFNVFVNYNGDVAGLIQQTGSTSVNYATSSDYRLKENVTAISDGITRLKTLKPSRFNFKVETDRTVDGFLAHEVTAVPEAITGTKDAVVTQAMIDEGKYNEGTLNDPIHQGIDQSKLVPLLTAALQEAIAKIETLETKVAALEAG